MAAEMIREGVKLPKGIQCKISDVVQTLRCDQDVITIFAFGSLVNDALKPLSDLDFGILLSQGLDKEQRFEKHIDLIGVFTNMFKTDEIDLINMNDAPHRISYTIIKTGKILLSNNELELANFYEQLVKKYLDFKYMRDEFDTVFLEGIGYHG